MHTFFNLRIRETNDLMRKELKELVIPFLKTQGWTGKKSRFRRIKGDSYQTLHFQFNKWGGSLAVNLDLVEPIDNFYEIKFDELKSLRSQRLGTRHKRINNNWNMDHWFKFMRGIIFYFPAYKYAAKAIVKSYESEAENIFDDMQDAINKGVLCIHLQKA